MLGLEAGADDYVTKPFEPSILAARLRAVLRRVARHDASPVLRVGELEIDRAGMEVRVAGEPVSLTPTEYRLLLELAEHSGVVCSRERLLEEVWGYVWAGDTRLVDMHVRRLRAKIGAGHDRDRSRGRLQAGQGMSSLRWRLALAFALLAATVAAAVGVVVYELTADDLLSRARAAAVAQVQAAALIYPLTKPSLPRSALPAGDPSVPAPLRAAVRRWPGGLLQRQLERPAGRMGGPAHAGRAGRDLRARLLRRRSARS